MSARTMIDSGAGALAAAGVETPRLDAELLLAAAAGVSRSRVVAGLAEDDAARAEATYEAWIDRRSRREPLAYITGTQGFRRIDLAVDPRVLIPRPETELLVAVAKVDRPCSILDVATGSGAVALALADELPDATILASDISSDALAVAAENAARLGADRVSFTRSNLLDEIEGEFDAIVANLPYVAAAEIAGLQPEITEYEPRIALDGGADGLDLVRQLAAGAQQRLSAGGLLALEIGDGQAVATAAILEQHGFVGVERHVDLAGIERVVSARAAR